MVYGILINNPKNGIKINKDILLKAGYRNVPSHVDGMQVDEQFISNAEGFNCKFPRAHIIHQGREWFIHWDIVSEDGHDTIIKMTPEIKAEISRLELIGKKLSTSTP